VTTRGFVEQLAKSDETPKFSQLLQLSDLETDQFGEFKSVWPSVPEVRRRQVIESVLELSEENLELDFTDVFVACLNDVDDEVREAATRGLSTCEDRTVIRPLVALLKNDSSVEVRAAAAIALGHFASMAQDGKLITRDEDRIRVAIMATIEREDEFLEVKRRAIETVAGLRPPGIVEIIEDAFDSGSLELKQSAIYAMGQTSSEEWLPVVLEEMQHEAPAIRFEAANTVGLLGDEGIVPELTELLEDDDLEVRLAAVKALGIVGGPMAKRVLRACLDYDDESLEEAARAALEHVEFDDDPLGLGFDTDTDDDEEDEDE
jgi:HEAT repeat protein